MGDVHCDILTGDEMCCVFVRYVDTTHEKIKSFTAPERFTGMLSEKVTHILFYRGTLPTFPSELSKFFPNLKYLEIYDCQLRTIYRDDLKDFENLERIKLESNKIEFLPGDLFASTPKITNFSFVGNRISKIGENFLDCMDNLIEADFSRNIGLNYHYRKEINGSLEELRRIIKENCKPLKSLQAMATEIIERNMNVANIEDLKFIADHLKIEKLRENIENFMKIYE